MKTVVFSAHTINYYHYRYEGDTSEKTEEEKQKEEREKLNKLLKKIEKNKKIRDKQRAKESKQKVAKQKTFEQRQLKRKTKASIIPVPENNDDFIDKSITENEDPKNKDECSNSNLKFPNSLEGFTILGAENIATKKKVRSSTCQFNISLQSTFVGKEGVTKLVSKSKHNICELT